MEGVSHEAASLAGHLRLEKLLVILEDDTGTEECRSFLAGPDDALRRFAALGWATRSVDAHDPAAISSALSLAARSRKPTLLACRTSIGRSWTPSRTDPDALSAWQDAGHRGSGARRGWLKRLAHHPLRAEFERVIAGRLPDGWGDNLAAFKAGLAGNQQPASTRDSAEQLLEAMAPGFPELVGGQTELGPGRGPPVTPGSFSGRQVHYGPREHGMAACLNGLALHGGVLPYAVAPLATTDGMRPALRLSAMMGLRAIHVATHDSIGLGADGAAYQPVEQLAGLRAIPGLLVLRPADAIEAAECCELAVRRTDGPSLLVLSEQPLPALRSDVGENRCARGAYVLAEANGPRAATLIASGSEVSLAMAARDRLAAEGIAVAVVSMPAWALFARADPAARAAILGGAPRFGIEAACGFGWERWLGEDGVFLGLSSFGASGDAGDLFRHFGLTPEAVAAAVKRRLGTLASPSPAQRGRWRREGATGGVQGISHSGRVPKHPLHPSHGPPPRCAGEDQKARPARFVSLSLGLGVLAAVFLGTALLGSPIGLAMLSGGFAYLITTHQDVGLVVDQTMNGLYNSYLLIAVPLFIFVANLMNASGVTPRLLAFGLALVGRYPGGLAQLNVVANLVFSGMSGSAVADAAGPGLIVARMMTQGERYPAGFAAATSVAAATIGPLVPPSIPMIFYALIANTSVGAMFLAGLVPAMLMAGALMVAIALIARRRGFPREPATPLAAIPRLVWRALPPLLLPALLLGIIYSGIATPTEAAAVAAAYALVLAFAVYRTLTVRSLLAVMADTVRTTATIGLIMSGAFVFNYAVANEGVPDALQAALLGMHLSATGFLLCTNLLMLLLAVVIDEVTILLVVVPLLVPVAQGLGIDPVQFGVVVVVNMMIGLALPPHGLIIFVVHGLTGTPVSEIFREVPVFIAAMIAVLLLVTYVPDLALALPHAAGYATK